MVLHEHVFQYGDTGNASIRLWLARWAWTLMESIVGGLPDQTDTNVVKEPAMPPGKRELARIERRLITTLTEACETAKSEIKGFTWLTHTADLNALAETLKVIWVFETLADGKLAQTEAKARIFELMTIALNEANIDLNLSDHNVRFDSEEECQRTHGGDWKKRLTQSRAPKGV